MIGQQVCFHSDMKHKNDVSVMVGCLQVMRIYSFMKRRLHMFSLYISSFSLLGWKIIIYKRNKTCSPCIHSLVTMSAKFERILSNVLRILISQKFSFLVLCNIYLHLSCHLELRRFPHQFLTENKQWVFQLNNNNYRNSNNNNNSNSNYSNIIKIS